jgi:hypothetical protein
MATSSRGRCISRAGRDRVLHVDGDESFPALRRAPRTPGRTRRLSPDCCRMIDPLWLFSPGS